MEIVLADYPSRRDELDALLSVAWELSSIRIDPPLVEAESGLAGFLQEARESRPDVASGLRLGARLANGWAALKQLWWLPSVRLLVGCLVALFLLLGALGGLANVAASSLPGNWLYPFKLTGEEVRLAFTLDQVARAEYQLVRAQNRAVEIQHLAERRLPIRKGTVARLNGSLEASLRASAEVNPVEMHRLLRVIVEVTTEHESALSAAEAAANTARTSGLLGEARQGLAQARELAQAGLEDLFGYSLEIKYGSRGIGLPSPGAIGVDQPAPVPTRDPGLSGIKELEEAGKSVGALMPTGAPAGR
jgi:hypothetical protein